MNSDNRSAVIRIYEVEPPVLDQCPSCINAVIDRFEPLNCPEINHVRTHIVTCLQDHDVFKEGACNSFQSGRPEYGISLKLAPSTRS